MGVCSSITQDVFIPTKIVDGDTIHGKIYLTKKIFLIDTIRIRGVDAAETPKKKAEIRNWLREHKQPDPPRKALLREMVQLPYVKKHHLGVAAHEYVKKLIPLGKPLLMIGGIDRQGSGFGIKRGARGRIISDLFLPDGSGTLSSALLNYRVDDKNVAVVMN